MAGYTVLSLKEVEDQAPRFGVENREYEVRMARNPLGCENSGLSYLRISPGFRSPFGHKHKQQEEVYVLISGSARVKLDDEIVELTPWTAVRIHRDTMRAIEGGPEGCELIAIGAPNTGPGDGINDPDFWTD